MADQSIIGAAFPARRRNPGLIVPFGILALSAIFLQKLGLTSATGSSIGIDVFILLGTLFWIFLDGRVVLVPGRAILFAALLASVAIALIGESFLGIGITSLPAVAIFLLIYSSLIFRVDVSLATALRCFSIFQGGMLVIAVIVIAQQAAQLSIGNQYWPNLNNLLPSGILIAGYAYIRPYAWHSLFLTPNGVFFLEPSIVSEYLAIAFAVELIWYRKAWRLALLAAGLITCMAGTGIAALALVSPLLVAKFNRRLLKWTISFGLPLLLTASLVGTFSHLSDRTAELSSSKSSGYARLVLPFDDTMALVGDPSFLITGDGPGSSPKGHNQVQWPANKLIYEYGLLTAVIFHIFLLWAVLGSPVSRTLALVVLIPHLFFGGGIVGHTSLMALVMFGSLFRLVPAAEG